MKKSPIEVAISELGVRPLARALGVARSTVSRWRRDGWIPSQHHQRVIEAGEGKITPHDLVHGREV